MVNSVADAQALAEAQLKATMAAAAQPTPTVPGLPPGQRWVVDEETDTAVTKGQPTPEQMKKFADAMILLGKNRDQQILAQGAAFQAKIAQQQQVDMLARQKAATDAVGAKVHQQTDDLAHQKRLAAEEIRQVQADVALHPPAVAATPGGSAQALDLEVQQLGPFTPPPRTSINDAFGASAEISKDGKRSLIIAAQGSQQVAYVDGEPGKSYPKINFFGNPHTDDVRGTRCSFSADSQSVAYQANLEEGNQVVVVANQSESPPYSQVESFTFAPVGHRFAYIATQGPVNDEHYLMVDSGKTVASPPASHVDTEHQLDDVKPSPPLFSPDGTRLAFIAHKEARVGGGSGCYVVVNGSPDTEHYRVDRLLFSGDSKHLAYSEEESKGGTVVVMDGVPQPRDHILIDDIVLSAQDGHLAYMERVNSSRPQHWADREVIDGQTGAEHDGVSDLTFNQDGSQWAYVALENENRQKVYHVVKNGRVGRGYEGCSHLQFKDDNQTVQYIAHANGRTFVVTDEAESSPYGSDDEAVAAETGRPMKASASLPTGVPDVVSPDGHHVVQFHSRDEGWAMELDGIDGPVVGGLTYGKPQFRADGALEFYGVMAGNTCRGIFSAATLAALPSQGDIASVTPGLRKLAAYPHKKCCSFTLGQDGFVYGVAREGGQYDNGYLFRVKPDGTGFEQLHDFIGGAGDSLGEASLATGADGGIYGLGTQLFHLDPKSKTYTAIAVPLPAPPRLRDIGTPRAPSLRFIALTPDNTVLFCGPEGILYRMNLDGTGVTQVGQSGEQHTTYGGFGAFYEAGVMGKLTRISADNTGSMVIHFFAGSPDDGVRAADSLPPIVGPDGMLYGCAEGGGKSMTGVIYKVNRDGSGYQAIYNPTSKFVPTALTRGDGNDLYANCWTEVQDPGQPSHLAEGLCRLSTDGGPMTMLQVGHFEALQYRHGFIYALDAANNVGDLVAFKIPTNGGATPPKLAVRTTKPTALPLDPISWSGNP